MIPKIITSGGYSELIAFGGYSKLITFDELPGVGVSVDAEPTLPSGFAAGAGCAAASCVGIAISVRIAST